MTNSSSATFNRNQEQVVTVQNGYLWLVIVLALYLAIPVLFYGAFSSMSYRGAPNVPLLISAILMIPLSIILSCGFFTLQPNEARVLILFGTYIGTVRQSGFHWGNPFYSNDMRVQTSTDFSTHEQRAGHPARGQCQTRVSRNKISLRARNLNGEKLKVNDKKGNPIEIASVVVWRVNDTAQAKFDVDDFSEYVSVQYESALRHMASNYAYDNEDPGEITLRSSVEEVSQALTLELQERLSKAGVVVEEARITHLAYAPEIAQTMLRRQQAEAIISARQKIVHGAVGMVQLALNEMAENQVVELDDERKAAMVSNLMVVLCGESEVHPVINAGTLYH